MTEAEVRNMLRALITIDYRQSDMAREAGLSDAYVSAVLRGKKPPSAALLSLIGVEKVVTVTYRKRA